MNIAINNQLANEYQIYRGLQSSGLFADANIVLGRNYLSSTVQADAIALTPAPSGKCGVGIIVQIPTIRLPKANGLQREREYSLGIYESPDINFTAGTGTFRDAIDWADVVIDFLLNWRLFNSGAMVPDERVAVPDLRFADQGLVGVRCVFTSRQERRQPARSATPTITVGAGNQIALSVTDGSAIYYTVDGFSYPSPTTDGKLPEEQAAVLYAGPFQAYSGQCITAVAWPVPSNPPVAATQSLPSNPAYQTIN